MMDNNKEKISVQDMAEEVYNFIGESTLTNEEAFDKFKQELRTRSPEFIFKMAALYEMIDGSGAELIFNYFGAALRYIAELKEGIQQESL